MKDFANRNSKKNKTTRRKSVFSAKRQSASTISKNSLILLLIICAGLVATSIFYFKTDVVSIKPINSTNSVIINFPTSLLENSVLIEYKEDNNLIECEYFVQIGAYGNRKYAVEAKNMLVEVVGDISINEVYSTLQPGKLLNSVLSGPYLNRSAANNAKEKVTKSGFDPRLRTLCKEK